MADTFSSENNSKNEEDFELKLEKLKKLFEKNLISESEYNEKKKEILEKM